MSAKFVQAGDILDYTPVSAVAAGDFVNLGFAVGVAKTPIAAGAKGAVALTGVYDVEVSALGENKAVGAALYIESDGDLAWTDGSGSNTLVGYVVEAASSGATSVRIRLA